MSEVDLLSVPFKPGDRITFIQSSSINHGTIFEIPVQETECEICGKVHDANIYYRIMDDDWQCAHWILGHQIIERTAEQWVLK
jgi:hypothetical protein